MKHVLQGSLTLYGGVKAPGWPPGTSLANWTATAVYLGYLAFQAGLHILLPGRKELGVPLRTGKRLTYKFTGALWCAPGNAGKLPSEKYVQIVCHKQHTKH